VQLLRSDNKNDPQMLVITDDIYLTWISAQPFGVKLSFHGRYVKLAAQWGSNGTRPDK
jgi:hypothetical protein